MKTVRSSGHVHSNSAVKLIRPTGVIELTFILLERPSSLPSTAEQNQEMVLSPSLLTQCRMVGDVNLFLPEGLEGDGECEIMIACMSYQTQKKKERKYLMRTYAFVFVLFMDSKRRSKERIRHRSSLPLVRPTPLPLARPAKRLHNLI